MSINSTNDRAVAQGSLGVLVETFLGQRGDNQRYSRAFRNWLQLISIVFSSPPDPRRSDFFNLMSGSQALSSHLLTEWWFAKIQNPVLSKVGETTIATSALCEKLPLNQVLPPELLQSMRQGQEVAARYKYHEELFLLWQAEFLSGYDNDDIEYLTTLQRHRHDAAVMASCQRTSWRLFHQFLEREEIPVSEAAVAGATSSGTNLGGDPTAEYRTRSMSWVIEPCPWLKLRETNISNQGTRNNLPYYLWDKEDGCTVEIAQLDRRPLYAVISHTWGRWRSQKPSVTVDGVPWLVPQNSRFDVQRLPDMLQRMDVTTRYIWIDLFCIPQDRSDPEQAAVYNSEVDRQAEIFASAHSGVIWLNDINSWSGLSETISWLCLQYLKLCHPNVRSLLPTQIDSITGQAQKPTGLFGDDTAATEPSGWFSSLWTLQEICLRPQMGLLNSEGKALFIGDDTMTLDGLLALESWVLLKLSTQHFPLLGVEIPRGPSELFRLSNEFQLDFLLDNNPLKVLGMTNQRYCRHSRARAVMSAIGATAWWRDHVQRVGEPPPETELVLGRFPLMFINEIRQQLGASFFGSVSLSPEYPDIGVSDSGSSSRRFGYTVIGSMMPFSSNAARRRGSHVWGQEHHDHPSVGTWRICPDGCVEMDEVGIVAARVSNNSLHVPLARGLIASIMALGNANQEEVVVGNFDLQEWIDGFRPGGEDIYAVCLCYGGPRSLDWGVILQRVPSRKEESGMCSSSREPMLLVKIGAYILQGKGQNIAPDTHKVQWLAL
ncbi:hypothetical protein BKA56DRAFT_620497 [Ilyonectria sp. MPI-CAGE-AT-0026]|nr:hypothetical protein BKA56DRAFT_620497 [Ilyonectria sp. MPI-CAGE-AT-0026]